MSFDPIRGETVLVGGYRTPTIQTDDDPNGTWEWNGVRWIERVTTPEPRAFWPATAWDSSRGRLLLFDGFGNPCQTWERIDGVWHPRFVPGPSARVDHAMAFDSVRGVAVLFGGSNLGDTWEWDGTAWTQKAVVGPPPRSKHAMVFDSARGVIVLYGGLTQVAGSNVILGDTWEYDGTAWRFRGTGPTLYEHAMAFDSIRGETVLHGGRSDLLSDLTWVWDGQSWSPRSVPRPPALARHAMAFDSIRGRIVLYGGYNGAARSDQTWEWDGQAWANVTIRPPARYGHAMVHDAARGKTLLFGGHDGTSILADTWEWDGMRWAQRQVIGPSRWQHRMAYDSNRGVVVLFGGFDPTVPWISNGETWEWNGTEWSLKATSGPPPRTEHAMSYDAARGVVVLFGGQGGGGLLADTWEWNGIQWSQRLVLGPSPRCRHAMAFDQARGVIRLVGGAVNSGTSCETWEWDGTAWLLRSAGGFCQEVLPMGYDASRGMTIMHGASVYVEWVGSSWATRQVENSRLGIPAPQGAWAYDPARSVFIQFGGIVPYSVRGETLELTIPCFPTIVQQPADRAACPGTVAQLSLAASSFVPISYQWRRAGVPLTDMPGVRSGVNSPTLSIFNFGPADVGSYDCVVTGGNGCSSVTSTTATLSIATNCPCSPADLATEGDPFGGPDGFLTGVDFDFFLIAFFQAARRPAGTGPYIADIATDSGAIGADGFLTGTDFDLFIQLFFEGC